MLRPDGSVKSANYPSWDNRYQVRDYGLYRGVIRDIIYTDDDRNDSGGDDDPNEVLYNVMIVGGDRDGQIFGNARLKYDLGGFANYIEYTLKKLEDPSGLDISDPESLLPLNKANGDIIYLQFVNGFPNLPLIVGFAHHPKAPPEAAESDGPRFARKYNGIGTQISRDGEFTWTKDNGAFVDVLPTDPLYPYINQFAPFPDGEEAVSVTLGNEYDFEFAYDTGLSFTIDGVKDEYALDTKVGTALTVSGTEDSFDLATNAGAEYKLSGLDDTHDFTTAAGTELAIKGTDDSITLSVAFGDSLSVSAKDGIQASTPTGTSLSMKNGQVDIVSGGQAALSLTKTGFIQLGNSSGDVFKDILMELLKSMSTATYAGFGAPGSNVADFIQLITKLQLLIGD